MCLPEHLYLQPLIQLRLLDTTHCFFELFLVTFESVAVALETEKRRVCKELVGCIELMVAWPSQQLMKTVICCLSVIEKVNPPPVSVISGHKQWVFH